VKTAQDGGTLSASRTDRLYPQGNAPGAHFCLMLSQEEFYVNEKSTDINWDRTNDLPICSTAP